MVRVAEMLDSHTPSLYTSLLSVASFIEGQWKIYIKKRLKNDGQNSRVEI